MADRWDRDQLRKLTVRGLGWCICVALWTVGLLTIFAARVGQAVTPEAFHFPVAKFLHISAYAFLTVYLKWLPLRRGRWLLLAFLSLHACATEFIQQFIPGRHGQFSDVMIDHVGIALGMALTWKCWRLRPSRCSSDGREQGLTERTRSSPDRFRITRTSAEITEK